MNMDKFKPLFQKPITFLGLLAMVLLLGVGYWIVTNKTDSISIDESKYDLTQSTNKQAFEQLVEAQAKLKGGFDFAAAIQRANSFVLLNDVDQAKRSWEYFIKNRPAAIQGYWGLAQIATKEGDYETAETNWLKAAEVDKTKAYDTHYIGLADLYRTALPEKRYKIVQIITTALPGHQSPGNLNLILANYYEDTQDYASAVRFYKEALKSDPTNSTLKAKINELENK